MKLLSGCSKDDKRILFFVALTWGVDVLVYVRAVVMKFVPPLRVFDSIFIGAIIITALLLAIGNIFKRIKPIDLAFYLFCCMLYLLTYIFFPENSLWLDLFLPPVLFQVLPFFFVGLLIDSKKHLDVIEYVSMLYIVLSLLYLYFTFDNRDFAEEEMGAAYALLPHLLIVLYSTIRKFRWYSLLLFILGLIRLTGTGNRGSLFCVVIFVILYILFNINRKARLIIIASFALLAIIIFPRLDTFLYSYSDFLGEVGFNVRVFNMVANGDLVDANGRDNLASFFISKIQEGGILGHGIMGDRTLLHAEDGYPHNLVLEFLIDFGVLFGTVFLVAIGVLLILAFKSCKTKDSKSLFLVFFTVGFISLFLSSSYLASPIFFLLIGFSVRLVRDNPFFKTDYYQAYC